MISDIKIYEWVEKNWDKLCKKASTYNGKGATPISVQIQRKFCLAPTDASNIARSVALWKNIKG